MCPRPAAVSRRTLCTHPPATTRSTTRETRARGASLAVFAQWSEGATLARPRRRPPRVRSKSTAERMRTRPEAASASRRQRTRCGHAPRCATARAEKKGGAASRRPLEEALYSFRSPDQDVPVADVEDGRRAEASGRVSVVRLVEARVAGCHSRGRSRHREVRVAAGRTGELLAETHGRARLATDTVAEHEARVRRGGAAQERRQVVVRDTVAREEDRVGARRSGSGQVTAEEQRVRVRATATRTTEVAAGAESRDHS